MKKLVLLLAVCSALLFASASVASAATIIGNVVFNDSRGVGSGVLVTDHNDSTGANGGTYTNSGSQFSFSVTLYTQHIETAHVYCPRLYTTVTGSTPHNWISYTPFYTGITLGLSHTTCFGW